MRANISKPAASSKFWYLLYGLIFFWIVFLIYFHSLSVQPLAPDNPATPDTNKPAIPAINTNNKDNSQNNNNLRKENPVGINTLPPQRDFDENIHIVFSTDCSFFQDWQTLAVFHSALTVKQRGRITRIASGCSEEKQKELLDLYKILFPQYSVHFTPDFKTDGKTKKKYDFYNKPYGLHHWLLNANPPIEDGVVIVLIDPDMLILRPFTLDFANDPLKIFMDGYDFLKENLPVVIGKGHPTAQLYGLGAPWAQLHSRNFNRKEICGEGSPCLDVTTRYGELHFR